MTDEISVVGGVDTHTDFHQAAVIDPIGRHLATEAFATTPCGYRQLFHWLRLVIPEKSDPAANRKKRGRGRRSTSGS